MSALSLRAASKTFGATHALRGVDLEIAAGEIHGLLGENGSGKSTLVKILTGYHAPDDGGTLHAWGEQVELPVRTPERHGIAVIHQDLGLADAMTVVENVGVGVGYGARALGAVNWRRERADTQRVIAQLGVDVDPDARVADLSPAQRTFVAIARAQRQIEAHGAQRLVLVLDEPTVSLPPHETDHVLHLMRSLAERGDAVLFISHRLAEVKTTTDRVTVLRDGEVVGACATGEVDEAGLAELILGRSLGSFYPHPAGPPMPEAALSVTGMSASGVGPVSFSLARGEILGVTGLTGQGQEEVPALLAGASSRAAGELEVFDDAGRAVPVGSGVRASQRSGIALVPGNRRRDGLWVEASARENLSLPVLRSLSRGGVHLSARRERSVASGLLHTFAVRPADAGLPAAAFSGGNQQKIVMAKAMQHEPRVLLLDEPTQGVDAGARRQILELVCETAAAGTAVVVASTDHEQLAAICHRVLVFRDGLVVAELESPIKESDLENACRIPQADQNNEERTMQ